MDDGGFPFKLAIPRFLVSHLPSFQAVKLSSINFQDTSYKLLVGIMTRIMRLVPTRPLPNLAMSHAK
ncbi:hypothetical protein SERLA73DRAFT_188110 [Serpula lacrymans var. lacrymans S7.3]|uniref:Uncharacterized protein n=2 Tax=Serpula lacrymans var. lacrymans TaxID=341189 RepID=F8QAS1_SERL3|nr:hypothetical protein SERLA73DRAFT_188110 [Serpula lacrymans var. lacrymans S7.3]